MPVEMTDEEYAEQQSIKAEQAKTGDDKPKGFTEKELIAQIQAMQAQIASLSAAQGIPTDPIEAGITNLRNHVEARKAANPDADVEGLLSALKAFENSEGDTDDIRDEVEGVIERAGGRSHSWVYLRELTRNLAKAVRENR